MTDTGGALRAVYDERIRGGPPEQLPGVVYERDGPVVRSVGQFRGFVFPPRDTGVRGAALDRLIARQRDRFAERGEAVEWRTHEHDEPPELPGRLLAAGFTPERRRTVLLARTSGTPQEPDLPEGVVVRRVTGERDMRRIAEMQSEVWGGDLSWLAGVLTGRTAAAPEETVVLTAEAAGRVVCTAWMFLSVETGHAGLRGGTTLPGWRGRGIYRSLVALRAKAAAERGVPYLHVEASADSRPVLTRLGFHAVTTMTPYVWTPPED
ncbi:Acetyltransferase (GNAT) domain-containing protein [Streptomyces sp. WMMB 714]|uniref:GNAT family N-acetyltransferase n=1 Tax=Streptomyces sp. WMMB 714 TaxID=1286822 RepID=UPI0005F89194|nr:N-acetyltransferase [Streptomyces sp. WMMB 714]SCK35949.1 Acetyltransferase (GNAT) domain-containing protein [Streptomyces sp. WMMB 714]